MSSQSITLLARNLRGRAIALVLAILALSFSALPAKAVSNPNAITINNSICDLTSAGYLGAGSVNNPWQISDSASLWETADCEAQNPGGNYVLTRSIDLTGASAFTRRAIGYVSTGNIYRFQGKFDGQGHSISNLNIEGLYAPTVPIQNVASAGLFAWLNDAEIKNLALSGTVSGAINSTVSNDEEYSTGFLGARSSGDLILSNLTISGSVSGYSRVGNLVGVAESVSATTVHVTGRVAGYSSVGGFFGHVSQSAAISLSLNQALIDAQFAPTAISAGGFIGFGEQIEISQSVNSGAVKGIAETGGFVGSAGVVTISASVNSGEVSGGSFDRGVAGTQAAGLVGFAIQAHFFQSANRGNVSMWGSIAGGLIGQVTRLSVEQSQNSGVLTTRDGNTGGIVGRVNFLDVKNSYNSGAVVANTFLGGLASRVISTARIESTYNIGTLSQSPQWSISRWLTPAVTDIDGMMAFGSGSISSSYTIPPSSKVGTSTVLELRMKPTYAGWDFVSIWGFDCNDAIATPKLRALSGNATLSSNSCPIAISNPGSPPPLPPSPNETPPGGASNSSTVSSTSSSTSSNSGNAGDNQGSGDRTPVLLGTYTTSPGLILNLVGTSLDVVNRVLIGTVSVSISASALTTLSVIVPISTPLGTHDLTLESNSGRFVKIKALTVKEISNLTQSSLVGRTFALPKFAVGKTTLNSRQRQFVSRLLLDSGVSKVVCTGLVRSGMTHHARVQVRLRAKAACNQVKFLLPNSSVWVQSRSTSSKQMLGRVIITIRG
jgi:hypothetical protein